MARKTYWKTPKRTLNLRDPEDCTTGFRTLISGGVKLAKSPYRSDRLTAERYLELAKRAPCRVAGQVRRLEHALSSAGPSEEFLDGLGATSKKNSNWNWGTFGTWAAIGGAGTFGAWWLARHVWHGELPSILPNKPEWTPAIVLGGTGLALGHPRVSAGVGAVAGCVATLGIGMLLLLSSGIGAS